MLCQVASTLLKGLVVGIYDVDIFETCTGSTNQEMLNGEDDLLANEKR